MAKTAVQSEQHWHALRAKNIGASEVAALFGASPYTTRFILWHEKSGKVDRPEFESERMRWGTLLEPVIAQGLADQQGWKIRKVHRYLTHPKVEGMGASLDYEVFGHPDGVGCFEIKNISIEAWLTSWLKHEDGSIEAPIHIELQLQHQLAVTGRPWGAFGILVGGNEGYIISRPRHEPTIEKIETAVAEFWQSVTENQVPDVTSDLDMVIVNQVFSGLMMVHIDDDDFEQAVLTYQKKARSMGGVKKEFEAAKAKLVDLMHRKGADLAIGRGKKVSFKPIQRMGYVVEPTEYRDLRVSELKED